MSRKINFSPWKSHYVENVCLSSTLDMDILMVVCGVTGISSLDYFAWNFSLIVATASHKSTVWRNMSKTSASVSSGVPNTKKQMKVRGRRPSAFIVSRCLEPLMKHEARVFDMTSQSYLKIQYNKACKIYVFPAGMVNSSCKSLPVFWKPFVAS